MNNADKPINPIVQEEYIAGNRILQCTQAGLTKREYFAGLAMQAMISNAPNGHLSNFKEGVSLSLQWTDELLKQLETTQAD